MPQVPTSFVPPAGAQTPTNPSSFGAMAPFVDSTLSPNVTGQLAEPQTGNLPTMTISPVASTNVTTPLRQPVVIRGSRKTRHIHPPPSLSKNHLTLPSVFPFLLC